MKKYTGILLIVAILLQLGSCRSDFSRRKYTEGWRTKNPGNQGGNEVFSKVINDAGAKQDEKEGGGRDREKEKRVEFIHLSFSGAVEAGREEKEGQRGSPGGGVETGREEKQSLRRSPGGGVKITVGKQEKGTPNENSIRQKVTHSILLGSLGLLSAGTMVFLIFSTTSLWIFFFLLATALLGSAGLKKALSAKMDIDQLSKRSQLKNLTKISGLAMTINIVVLSLAGLFAFLYLLNLVF